MARRERKELAHKYSQMRIHNVQMVSEHDGIHDAVQRTLPRKIEQGPFGPVPDLPRVASQVGSALRDARTGFMRPQPRASRAMIEVNCEIQRVMCTRAPVEADTTAPIRCRDASKDRASLAREGSHGGRPQRSLA